MMAVMKEKLYKTNRKRSYYRLRSFLMVSFIVCSAAIAISIPTYIALNNKEAMTSKAEEVDEVKTESYIGEDVA